MIRSQSSPATALAIVLAILSGAAALPAAADPPGRVGRISDVEGSVSFKIGSDGDWAFATLNYPVTDDMSFWTEPGARDELQIGAAELRMDQSTDVDILHLHDDMTEVRLNQGSLNVHVRVLFDRERFWIDTPDGRVEVVQPGTYHIDAGGNGRPTRVVALEGEARFDGSRSYVEIRSGEAADVRANPESFMLTEAEPTRLDDWALARERREAALVSTRYVSPATPGVEDLDAAGSWVEAPSYGAVWYPRVVPAGWAPYRFGHWAWVAPWGWTWIDDQPWGFAPFHYGRWAFIEGRWGWVPGAVVARPVYAPALVAFIGGGGFSLTIATGSVAAVGWVPLGPREVYYPPYAATVAYVRNVNVTHVDKTVINNITVNNATVNKTVNVYANRQAATVVPATAMQSAAPIAAQAAHHADAARPLLAHAQVSANLNVTPTPAARSGGTVAGATAPAPRRDLARAQSAPTVPSSSPVAASASAPSAQQHTFADAGFRRPPPTHQPAQVVHPALQARVAATPQGWVRTPNPSHAPRVHPQGRPEERGNRHHEN